MDYSYSYISSLFVFLVLSCSLASLFFPCATSFCLAASRSFKEERACGFSCCSFFSSSRLNFSTPLLSLSSICTGEIASTARNAGIVISTSSFCGFPSLSSKSSYVSGSILSLSFLILYGAGARIRIAFSPLFT